MSNEEKMIIAKMEKRVKEVRGSSSAAKEILEKSGLYTKKGNLKSIYK